MHDCQDCGGLGCEACSGTGRAPARHSACPDCGGAGFLNGPGPGYDIVDCPYCAGDGQVGEARLREREFAALLDAMAEHGYPAGDGVDAHLEAKIQLAREMGRLPGWIQDLLVRAVWRNIPKTDPRLADAVAGATTLPVEGVLHEGACCVREQRDGA